MKKDNSTNSPAIWNTEELKENWLAHLESLASESSINLSMKRLRYQTEEASSYHEIVDRWSEMNSDKRTQAWEQLLGSCEQNTKEMLPICVQCGDCCRKGSPTLLLEDLELLREEKIPWDQMVTLRKGEPARSPYTDDLFYLPAERIKLRERNGTRTCGFLDDTTGMCNLHIERPIQCRAQACWDPEPARELANEPHLTRRHIFEGMDVLLEMMDEHDRRCSFEQMRNAFEELKQSEGKNIDEVVEFLAFEDHFRHFTAENLKIPENTLDLVFGRSLISMVRLFGFRVDVGEDGTRTLLPELE
ncbi:MAG: YkgJ family cysteine cluster protein [Proteobacteria bacterium]|nr:YkgJ family cysteine cluster protein [Pseudomonadota bacterium]